jgi:protein DGCR14
MDPAGARAAALRRLEDPLAYQVLPSRSVIQGGGPPSVQGGDPRVPLAHRAAPRARPLARDAGAREVLPDDSYAAAVDAIVEARWFPDLPRLRQQLAWLTALEGGDPLSIARARAAAASSVRRAPAAVSATPTGAAAGDGGGGGSVGGSVAPPPPPLREALPRLEDFLARFTSQGADEFRGNFAARLANVRQRSWWLHAHVDGARQRAMLADGHAGRAAPAPAALLADAVNEAGVALPGGGARGTVATWRWRPRSALFFPPDLAASNSVCGVAAAKPNPDLPAHAALLPPDASGGGDGARLLALCGGGPPEPGALVLHGGGGLSARYAGLDLVLPSGARLKPSGSVRAPAAARPAATRLGGRAGAALAAGAAARAPAPSDHYGLPLGAPTPRYELLATPLLLPAPGGGAAGGLSSSAPGAPPPPHGGAVLVTPIVTWGTLAGTPLMLDPPAPPPPPPPATAAELAAAFGVDAAPAGAPAYALPPPSARDAVRDGLLGRAAAARRPQPATAPLLAAAAAATAAGLLGSAPRGAGAAAGGGATPVYSAAGTPSALRFGGGARAGGGGGGAASVAPSLASRASAAGRPAADGMLGGSLRHARASAEAALQRLPPAARALVSQAAAQGAAAASAAGARRRGAGGDLEGGAAAKRGRGP